MKNYETTINLETIEKFNAMKQTMKEMLEELQFLYDQKSDELEKYEGMMWEEEEFTSEQYQRYEALDNDTDRLQNAIDILDNALDMYLD